MLARRAKGPLDVATRLHSISRTVFFLIFMPSWIVRSHLPSSAGFQLFAFSNAGGGSAGLRGWAERLGGEIELKYVQLPGRESRLREPTFTSLRELIPCLVDAISPDLERPFAFYGHSLGAKIAFEAARELRRRGAREPEHLFVAACPAPQTEWPHPLVHRLETREFLREIENRYGGIPRPVMEDPELLALLVPTLRADVTMMETYVYRPEPPLACGITAFGGRLDRMVSETSLRAWGAQTNGRFDLRMIDGDHFFPHAKEAGMPEAIAVELRRHSGLWGMEARGIQMERGRQDVRV